jgi:F420H(2)-dependent quinone reductase
VEVGTDRFPVVASVTSEPERTRLYDKMIAMMPVFAEYRLRTSRVIPVIILQREDAKATGGGRPTTR